jgi:hypothetical protein
MAKEVGLCYDIRHLVATHYHFARLADLRSREDWQGVAHDGICKSVWPTLILVEVVAVARPRRCLLRQLWLLSLVGKGRAMWVVL